MTDSLFFLSIGEHPHPNHPNLTHPTNRRRRHDTILTTVDDNNTMHWWQNPWGPTSTPHQRQRWPSLPPRATTPHHHGPSPTTGDDDQVPHPPTANTAHNQTPSMVTMAHQLHQQIFGDYVNGATTPCRWLWLTLQHNPLLFHCGYPLLSCIM